MNILMGSLSYFTIILIVLVVLSSTGKATNCPTKWFDCGNGKCISMLWHCDGEDDCLNQQDEVNCSEGGQSFISTSCPSNHFHCNTSDLCLPEKWRCDGHEDCPGGGDEKLCVQSDCLGFRCKNNECIPDQWRCDDIEDCKDGSDELDCSNRTHHTCSHSNGLFECSSGECISRLKVCNGQNDCFHGDDEGAQCTNADSCGHHNCSHGCFVKPLGEQCFCRDGYELGEDGRSCHDIDECAIPGFCSHTCANLVGGYLCTCFQGYSLHENRSCLADGPEPILLFSDQERIRAYYLRSKRYVPVHDAIHSILGLDLYGFDQTVYWADHGALHSGIYSVKLDGTNFRPVVSSGLTEPEDVAVDWVGRNIYITDASLDKLVVCKLDGSICATLHSDIHKPRAISVDPATGYLFWTEWGRSAGIYMSGMDGSDQMPIATTNLHWPNGLTYDSTTSRIYWADAKLNRIEYFDVHTRHRAILLEDTVFNPFAMTVFEDNLYWSDMTTSSLDVCNKFTGRNQTMLIRENGRQMMGIHVYHPVQHQHVNNPCWANVCSHLCLLGPRKTFKCACPGHMILSRDGQICEANATEFILLGIQKSLKRVYPEAIGTDIVLDMVLPHHFVVGDYTYDSVHDVIYLFDSNKYALLAVNATTGTSRILYSTHLDSVQGLTYDDCTANLYWLDGNHGILEVASVTKSARATLIKDMERPVDLVLHPDMKYLYIANLGTEPYIMRADMDGKNVKKLLASHIGLPVSLFLDEHANLLYWADAKLGTIEQLELSEESIMNARRMIVRDHVHHVMSMTVAHDTLYWTDMDSGYLYHAPLLGKHERATLVSLPGHHNTSSVKKIRLVHRHDHVNHYGCENNGGCSDICVLSAEGATCICSEGRRLLSGDKKACVDEQTTCKTEDDWMCEDKTGCIMSAWRCDGNFDCDDKSDEAGCASECPEDHFQCDNGKCIMSFWKCDQVDDCGDQSDEGHNCTGCVAGLFSCGQGQCVPYAWRCDGKNDCSNKEDENECDAKVCANDNTQLQCEDGQCVPKQWACDGENDCNDGTDERDCHLKECTSEQFKCRNSICIDNQLTCDKNPDCTDGSDEEHCDYKPVTCHPDQFTCESDGRCVYPNDVCDGFRDCEFGEDEHNCSNHHICSEQETYCDVGANMTCIPLYWLCDGENDCGDWSDERRPQCTVRSEVLPTTTGRPCKDSSFPCGSGDCIPYELVCNGNQDCLDGSDEGSHCEQACLVHNGGCSQGCHGTPTGVSCFCHKGFELNVTNGKDCFDIDECNEAGICSHYCNNTKGSFKCSCAHGYQLATDERRCKPDPEISYAHAFVMYQLPDKIRSIGLRDNEQHVIAQIDSDDMKGMDYDFETASVFWVESQRGAIMAHSLAPAQPGHMEPGTRVVKDGLTRPAHLSWDWLARNLYFFSEGYVMAVSGDGFKFEPKLLPTAASYINSLLVIPEEGLLFFSVWSDESTSGVIERANMDGQQQRRIVSNDNRLKWPSSLTSDVVHKLLYWTDTGLDQVGVCDYNGRHRKILLAYSLARPFGMGMFADFLYIANFGTDVLTKVSKFDGQARVIFHRGGIKSEVLKVVHKVLQFDGINYCQNITCSNMCLLKPKGYACSCDPGYALYDNGKCVLYEDFSAHQADSSDKKEHDHDLLCPSDLCGNGGTCYIEDKKPTCECIPGFFGRTCREIMISEFQHEEASVVAWVFGGFVVTTLLLLLVMMMMNYRRYDFSHLRQFSGKLRTPTNPFKSNPLKRFSIHFNNPLFNKFNRGRANDSLVKDTDDSDEYDAHSYQGEEDPSTVIFMGKDRSPGSAKYHKVGLDSLTRTQSGTPLINRNETELSLNFSAVNEEAEDYLGLKNDDRMDIICDEEDEEDGDTQCLTNTSKKREGVMFY